MPLRSMPEVSSVVPSIHSAIQSSGCSAARSWRFSLTGPSARFSRLGKSPAPPRSAPWQVVQVGVTWPMSASPRAGSGATLPVGADAVTPGTANGGFSPARFDARYTPPTRNTKTVSPIAHGGTPRPPVSIGVWTVIGSVPRRWGGLAGHDVLDRLSGGVDQEEVRDHRQAAERDETEGAEGDCAVDEQVRPHLVRRNLRGEQRPL